MFPSAITLRPLTIEDQKYFLRAPKRNDTHAFPFAASTAASLIKSRTKGRVSLALAALLKKNFTFLRRSSRFMQYHIISNNTRELSEKSPADASLYKEKDCQKSFARNYSPSDKRRRMG
jgi:hypothetical protein